MKNTEQKNLLIQNLVKKNTVELEKDIPCLTLCLTACLIRCLLDG